MDITFEKVKETKNKVRFQEQTPEGDDEKIGTLYVSKDAVAELGKTDEITVTLS